MGNNRERPQNSVVSVKSSTWYVETFTAESGANLSVVVSDAAPHGSGRKKAEPVPSMIPTKKRNCVSRVVLRFYERVYQKARRAAPTRHHRAAIPIPPKP